MRSQMDHSLYFAARGSLVRRRYTFAKLLSSMRKILASSSLVQLRVTVNLSSRRLWRENHDRKWNETAFEFNYILEPIFSPLDAWIGSSPVAVGIAHSPVCWFWTDRGGQKNVTICRLLHSKGHNYAEFTWPPLPYTQKLREWFGPSFISQRRYWRSDPLDINKILHRCSGPSNYHELVPVVWSQTGQVQ